MRQHIFSLTTAVSLVAVSPAITACGDKWTGDAVPADAPGVDSAPVDAGLPSCAAGWSDLQLGTDLDDQVWGMTLDRDHNVYISGFEEGVTGVTNIEPAGNSRGVVIRLDPKGRVQWKAVLDTAATDVIEHVAVDSASGKSFAVGRTSGAFHGFSNQGQFDAFLVELDAKGQTTTLFQWGDERPQHPVRLSLGPRNDLAVAGFDDTYVPSNYVEAWEAGFIAGLDTRRAFEGNFTQRFLQKVPNRQANRITDVVVDRDGSGSMYITSYVSGPPAQVGTFVKKLDSDGATIWSTRISSVWVDMVSAIALSPADELVVTGATFLSLGGESSGQQDAFVLKLDKKTGRILWATQAGSEESDYPTALALDDVGNIYVAGDTLGSVGPAGQQGGVDIFAMKFDPTGALLSVWQKGTAGTDSATSMVVDQCGRVLIGGYTRGVLVEGPRSPAGNDMFVVRAAL